MPASKPAFDAALDSGNALTTGIVWASWFAEDEANPTRLTDVSGNGNHGTLIGLDPARELVISGGTTYTAYNQTYTPSGGKWVSADGLYQCSLDDMGKSWVLCPLNDTMNSVAYNYYSNPWEGTWNGDTFTVAQGDLMPGPWFDDGLQFNGSGIVEVGDIGSTLQPGTGNFSITFDYTLGQDPATATEPDTLFYWSPSTADPGYSNPLISVLRWAGPNGWGDPLMRIDFRDGAGNIAWETFAGSGAAWVQNSRVVVSISFERGAYAKLYINGTYVAQQTISHVSGSLSGMAVCNFGKFGTGWPFKGTMHTCLYHKGVVLTAAQAAEIAADIYDLAAAAGPEAQSATAGFATATASGLQATAANAPLSATADLADATAAGLDATAALAPLAATAGLAEATASGLQATGVAVGMPSLYYAYPDPLLSAQEGATVEFDLLVDSSDSGADKGGCAEICDGTYQYIVFHRADGFNIAGQPHVDFDLTDGLHRGRLTAQNGVCWLKIDDQLRQYGTYANMTARRETAFGSWPGNP